MVVATGALVGYIYGGAIVACAGKCGSLLLQNLAAFLNKVPVAITGWGWVYTLELQLLKEPNTNN